jgi:hypothetical protein
MGGCRSGLERTCALAESRETALALGIVTVEAAAS